MQTSLIAAVDLGRLLGRLFSADELLRLLAQLPDGEALTDELRNDSPANLFADAASAVIRRGLQEELYSLLLRERPNQREAIDDAFGLGHLSPPRGPTSKITWTLPDRRCCLGPHATDAQRERPLPLPELTLRAVAERSGDEVRWSFFVNGTLSHTNLTSLRSLERVLGEGLDTLIERVQRQDTEICAMPPLADGDLLKVGVALGGWLWGPERQKLMTRLYPTGGAAPGPLLAPARLRLELPDGPLTRLPWAWIADFDTFLVDRGWTVERALPGTQSVSLRNPCPTLLIIPEGCGTALGAARHRRDVFDLLRQRWDQPPERYVRVARSLRELDLALEDLRPELIYVYGKALGEEADPELWMDDKGGHRPASIRALLARAPTTRAVMLNVLEGPDLGPLISSLDLPFVLAPGADGWPAHRALAGLDWLGGLFGGRDPVDALHRAAPGSLSASLLVPSTRYVAWSTGHVHRPSYAGKAREHLDRSRQKIDLAAELDRALLGSSGHRVATVVAMGDDHQRVQEFNDQAIHWLTVEGAKASAAGPVSSLRAPLNLHAVQPKIRQWTALGLSGALQTALHEEQGDLRARLAGFARRQRRGLAPRGVPVLWIGWGELGPNLPGEPSRRQKLEIWLEFAEHMLVPATSEGLRVVSFLAIQTAQHDGTREIVLKHALSPPGAPSGAALRLPLHPLGDVPRRDIEHFLASPDQCSCSLHADPVPVSHAILARARRPGSPDARFDLAVDLIELAERYGWRELELEGRLIMQVQQSDLGSPAFQGDI